MLFFIYPSHGNLEQVPQKQPRLEWISRTMPATQGLSEFVQGEVLEF